MPSNARREDPRAVRIRKHADVPNESVGYFSHSGTDSIDARKDAHGRWFRLPENTLLKPSKGWVFTSHSGPANDAALKQLVRDELLQEAIGFTHEQAGTVVGALYDKLSETEHYLRSYREDRAPRAEDLCCDYHRLRFEDQTKQYESLRGRKKAVKRLIDIFERFEHSHGSSATRPHDIQQDDLEAIADQVVWGEGGTTQITEKQLAELLRQAAMLGR